MVGDGLADRTQPQAGEAATAPVADDEHVRTLGGPHQGVGGATLDEGPTDLDVGLAGGCNGRLDDIALHALDLGDQVEGVERDVAEVGGGRHVGGGVSRHDLDDGSTECCLLQGPDEGGPGVPGSLDPDDDILYGSPEGDDFHVPGMGGVLICSGGEVDSNQSRIQEAI